MRRARTGVEAVIPRDPAESSCRAWRAPPLGLGPNAAPQELDVDETLLRKSVEGYAAVRAGDAEGVGRLNPSYRLDDRATKA